MRNSVATMRVWLLTWSLFIVGLTHAEVYIVMMDEPSALHYEGHITGYASTAAAAGSKVDSSSIQVQAYASFLRNQHDTILESMFDTGSYEKLYSYDHLINGFSVNLSPEQAENLKQSPRVKHIAKEEIMRTQTTYTPQLLGLVHHVWPQFGGPKDAGEGIVIGVIDTGINPDHPSFFDNHTYSQVPAHFKGKCQVGPKFPAGTCNGKLVGAQYFAKGAIADGKFNKTIDLDSPYDTNGHGSHTASTAAGNYGVHVTAEGLDYGNASGMAPGARISVYRGLFATTGYTSDIIAAIEQAVKDGVDIITLSLGPDKTSEGPCVFMAPFEITLLSAVHAGVVVVQAAGNSGPGPETVISYSPWVLSVAASNTGRSYASASLKLGNGKMLAAQGMSHPTPAGKQYPLVFASDAFIGKNFTEESCLNPANFDSAVVHGKILVCQYKNLTSIESPRYEEAIRTVKHLKGVGLVMLLDPGSSHYDGFLADPHPLHTPAIIINVANISMELHTYYQNSVKKDAKGKVNSFNALASIGDGHIASYPKPVPIVTQFSSRGPNILNHRRKPVDVLKPNILAPGNLIWAAWAPAAKDNSYRGSFAMVSGTSMAAPHVAGVTALIKQKHPAWSPAAITSAIMTTASNIDSEGKAISALNTKELVTGTPFDYGAGFINASRALDPGLVFDAGYEDYVNFLCALKIENPPIKANGTNCSSALNKPYNLNSPSITFAYFKKPTLVQRNVKSVTDITETYTASVIQPQNVTVVVTPSKFTVKAHESVSFTVHLKLTTKQLLKDYVFGQLVLTGDKGHHVQVPITLASK